MEYFEYPLLQRCERWVNEFNADTEPTPFYQFIASGILVNFIGLSMHAHAIYFIHVKDIIYRGKNLCDSNKLGMAKKYSVLTFVGYCTFA